MGETYRNHDRPSGKTRDLKPKKGQLRSAGRGENLRTYATPTQFYRQKLRNVD
jgi:hypothetical protein